MSLVLNPRPSPLLRLCLALPFVLIIALVLSLLITAPTAVGATTIPEREPNNTTATAQPVASGTTVDASFGAQTNCGVEDCDVYKVTAASGGRLHLDLRFASTLGTEHNFQLIVTNAVGDRLMSHRVSSADYDGSRLRGQSLYVPAGTVYVTLRARVGRGAFWTGQRYTLRPTVTAAVAESEINDSTSLADLIVLGRAVSGSTLTPDCASADCDVYRAVLPRSTRLSVDLRFACTLGTGSAYLVTVSDNLGQELADLRLQGGDCSGSRLRALPLTAPAGNVYIKVWGFSQYTTWGQPYTLKVSGIVTSAAPSIVGTRKVGSTLTARPSTWSPSPITLRYQWLRNGKTISGATKSTYALASADAGKSISVRVTGSRTGYISASRTSAAAAVPLRLLTSTPTPTISGTPKVRSRLTARAGTWSPAPVTLRYQWLRSGATIRGATQSTYTLGSADVGRRISVRVIGSKSTYKSVAKTSAATGAVRR